MILEKPQFGPAVSDLLAIDIPDVLQISEECGLCMWSFNAYAAEIERDDSIMIKLSDDNRKAIGFAVGRVFSVGIRKFTVELTNIGLRKDFRNRGYGSMLLRTFLDKCRADGASEVVLEVRVSNLTAIRFYEKFGFSHAGNRSGFYSDPLEDALTMRLTL